MKTKDFYNAKSLKYRVSGQRESRILDLLPPGARNVLDVGCGPGLLAETVKKKLPECRITGIDISALAIEKAGKIFDQSFCFDFQDGAWPEKLLEQRFDVIIASEIIEHLFDPAILLENLKKVLAEDGKLIVTTPNFLFWKNRLHMLFGKFRYAPVGLLDFGHIRFFSVATLRETLEEAGFTVEEENNFYPNLYKRGLNFLGRVFPGFFAYQIILRAKVA